jgi:Ca2+-binding EF-hand superfamily protein
LKIKKVIESYFKAFDANGDGTITINEMRNLFTKLNIKVDQNDLNYIFQSIDIDGNGEISYEEFKTIWETIFD